MIFNKVNESYNGFEVTEEGWLHSIGLCLTAAGAIGTLASFGLLATGGGGMALAVGSSASFIAGVSSLMIDRILTGQEIKRIFSKSPAIVKYLDNYYKAYKKKNPKAYFNEYDITGYIFDQEKSNAPISATEYFVRVNMGEYDIIVVCDKDSKTIEAIYLLVFYTYDPPKGQMIGGGYYSKYERIPAPSQKELEKVGLKIKK